MDHFGDDIRNNGSAWNAATECSNLPNCKGFNSNGWIKTAAAPLAPESSSPVCFYTKIPAPPPPTPACLAFTGYIATPGMDHFGDDIRNNGSAWNAATECSNLPNCKGFNSNGWIKTAAAPLAPESSPVCFYTKIPAPPPPTPACLAFTGYIATPGVDHFGDDIRNNGSARNAATECSKLPNCKGFNSNGWIKTAAAPLAPESSPVCFYTKIPVS
ncbi:hypothetical protein Vretimale_3300 [Volvox reticuliferus]|uniref:Uncharacterized protein n=1 Tax=Volvox reticuliferus TaxID=1737510 RepID=A0A8J4G4L7_9CHLO|nr:hypothetical protein Vretimale_3300 [Volvox reticuliferus]GIL97728.1 hypothetical protein Vretimale_3300 [Volvox reticuliferus]GIL97729.1 hypothetical protein Vretimale_3300 [Volvox reticuliferus]